MSNNKGAAILDFGAEFGGNSVEKTMRNDGPDLSANNLRSNKVTPYTNVSSSDPVNDDSIKHMSDVKLDRSSGYRVAKGYGGDRDNYENLDSAGGN